MTTTCLSIFELEEPQALNNHRHYCTQMGYVHQSVSMVGLQSSAHRLVYKYELLLHHLRRLPEDGLLIVATEDCVFFGMHPVEAMAQGREWLLPGIDGEGYDRQTAIQVWRNTPAVRRLVLALIDKAKLTKGIEHELELHASDLEYLPAYAQLAGNHVAVKCGVRYSVEWAKHRNIWTLVLTDIALYARTHPLFRSALFEHINDCQQKGSGLFQFPAYREVEERASGVHQPGQAVAVVMYYTPNIRQFGAVAQANFERYCQRHGYTLYVYRETPADVEPGISGTWLKPWLLRKHIEQHDWVVWVDADVLFIDQSQRLDVLMDGRDILAAHDVGPWLVNAGVLGFKNTARNAAFLDDILHQIRAVPDKSSTYASGGDQTVIANRLASEMDWSLEAGLDMISMNTPWFFQQDSSLMVHYYGMATELRAVIMAAQDRRSIQLSAR